jgi:hypothetical protein
MFRFALIMFVSLLSVLSEGATYYVDANSVGGNGTTTELTGPNAALKNPVIWGLKPGDVVLFHRGQTWTEMLYITNSGEPNNYITFDAYGTGKAPLIDVSGKTDPTAAIWVLGADMSK